MGWAEKLMRVLYIIEIVFILNIFWILGSILGLGIFGILPATRALNQTIHRNIFTDESVRIQSLGRQYVQSYKSGFKEVSKYSFAYSVIYFLIWLDLSIARVASNEFGLFLTLIMIAFFAYVLMTNIYLILSKKVKFGMVQLKQIMVLPFATPFASILYVIFLISLLTLSVRYSFLFIFGSFSIAVIVGKAFLLENMERKHFNF